MAKNKADTGGRTLQHSERRDEANKEEQAEVALEATYEANIEVGDFLSDLAVSLRYRDRVGVERGDWIEEPGRAFSDGKIFGEEIQTAAEGKLQVSLSLDTSTSMFIEDIMGKAGPLFQALHDMIRKAQQDLAPGVVSYAPFVFHGKAFKVPESFLKYLLINKYEYKYNGQQQVKRTWPQAAKWDDFKVAIAAGELPPQPNPKAYVDEYRLTSNDSLVAPLFKAIRAWEQANDPNATRLDIIITDGKFEDAEDVAEASSIQDERNGKLTTVMLNFLPIKDWSHDKLPERCIQYPVTLANIGTSVRKIIEEAVSSML